MTEEVITLADQIDLVERNINLYLRLYDLRLIKGAYAKEELLRAVRVFDYLVDKQICGRTKAIELSLEDLEEKWRKR
jgi:hypothetical protein